MSTPKLSPELSRAHVESERLTGARPSDGSDGGGSRIVPSHEEARLRLALQRRAPSKLRRHAIRALTRVSVLAVADLAAFWLMRAAYRYVRDGAPFGEVFSRVVQVYLPPGFLAGWQFALALLLGLAVSGSYGPGDKRRDPARLLSASVLASALVLWAPFWSQSHSMVVLRFGVTALLAWLALALERKALDTVVQGMRHGAPLRTLVLGPERGLAPRGRTPLDSGDDGDIEVIGHLAAAGDGAMVDELRRALVDERVDAVLLTSRLSDEQFEAVAAAVSQAGCQLLAEPTRLGIAGVWPQLVWRRGRPLMQMSAPSLRAGELVAKRVFDLATAVFGLLLISPLMLAIAAAVKLDSPGPAFFRQERIGRGGRRFRVWKFRTMVHGAPSAAHRELVTRMLCGEDDATAQTAGDGQKVFKLVNDERVTHVGRWLRRYSLDELPQLFNVVRGEMSLVGPRPPLTYEVESYDHWQFDRLGVRPGITGLWQVSGRNLLSYRQMCELDVSYLREWSLWLDLKILLKTIPVVLFNSGRAA